MAEVLRIHHADNQLQATAMKDMWLAVRKKLWMLILCRFGDRHRFSDWEEGTVQYTLVGRSFPGLNIERREGEPVPGRSRECLLCGRRWVEVVE